MNRDQILMEKCYEQILERFDPHMGRLFKIGDEVMLKHSSIENPTGIHADYKPGDLFEVVGRVQGTSPTRRFYVKAKDTGKTYSVHGYHIQQANKPLGEPVIRVSRKLGIIKDGVLECANCKKEFNLDLPGKRHRDHCPHCLCSVHIDQKPGDRSIWCGEGEKGSKRFKHSILRPVAKSSAEFPAHILYQCEKCGKQKVNVQAADDDHKKIENLPVKEFQVRSYDI